MLFKLRVVIRVGFKTQRIIYCCRLCLENRPCDLYMNVVGCAMSGACVQYNTVQYCTSMFGDSDEGFTSLEFAWV